MTPDEIRAHLARGWLDNRDRQQLKRQLERMEGQGSGPRFAATTRPAASHISRQPTASAPPSPSGDGFEHIAIKGPPAFARMTKTALAKLRRTPSWGMVSQIRSITAARDSSANGWCVGRDVSVDEKIWRDNPAYLPGLLAHEASHAAHGDARSTPETERRAYTNQAKALREIGASRSLVAYAERCAASPPHFRPGAKPIRVGTPVAADALPPRKCTLGFILKAALFGPR